MTQNIYDDPDFFKAYSSLQRQVHGFDGAPEWNVVRNMIPNLTDKHVLDLGCGFGWFSRWAREHGASSVKGLDVSERMIARAKAMTSDTAIEYVIADLETVELLEGSFDVAYSSLAFHYIKDFPRLVQSIYKSLKPNSHLVFTIEHPIYMAAIHPDWLRDANGNSIWPVSNYANEGERRTNWLADGVVKYHRQLSTTLNTLIDAGFVIRRVEEFAPTREQIRVDSSLAPEAERPPFLLVAAQR